MLGVKAATWGQVVLRGSHFYEGHAAAGGHTALMACVPPGDHGDIRAPDATSYAMVLPQSEFVLMSMAHVAPKGQILSRV